MPTTVGRRVGIVTIVLLLVGAVVLGVLPFGAGAVRVGGLSLLWWYAAVLAPALAVVVTVAVLVHERPRADGGASPASSA